MKVLGIDPGSRTTGWGVVERRGSVMVALGAGCVRVAEAGDLARRLPLLARAVDGLLSEYQPDLVAVETLYQGINPRSAIVLAHARGAILATIGQRGFDLHEVAPAEVKSSVAGNGRADKQQMIRMVRMLLGIRGRLASDAADALAVALCVTQLARHRALSRSATQGRGASSRSLEEPPRK
jgi:crossover junction endodeoxyribonuclease RuvC